MDTSKLKLFTTSITVEHKKKLLKHAADKDQFAYEALHEVLEAGFRALATVHKRKAPLVGAALSNQVKS